jgi:hypothetical protein
MTRKMEEGKVCNDEEMEEEKSAMTRKWKGANRQRW